jgi:hypothetical protein
MFDSIRYSEAFERARERDRRDLDELGCNELLRLLREAHPERDPRNKGKG